jgi:3-hydroxypropanoate dehydrogenase
MTALDDGSLDLIFRDARTHGAWRDLPVSDDELRKLYELTRLGPTSLNTTPLRVVFVKSAAAKARLVPSLMPMNVDKVRTAPVTAILAFDSSFHEHMGQLQPHRDVRPMLAGLPEPARLRMGESSAMLQAGYFILAARGLGLDAGPLGGFDAAKVNEAFFPDGRFRTMLLVNLGHGDPSRLHPRNPRLAFEDACRIE